MAVPDYQWPLVPEFLDRDHELSRLEDWWASSERMPVNLYGRRRAGKSWLFRRFAHGKPAILLVAQQIFPGAQLDCFADRLEPILGLRPALPDLPALFRVLFRAAQQTQLLVVIDEFPWLLPGSESGIESELSAIQAVLEEERDRSRLKLMLCGSMVGQMEALQAERSPLHGRLVPMQLRPLQFGDARLFLSRLDPVSQFERFAIAGGMPRYLTELAGPDLKRTLCRKVLDRNGPLWDEARTILDQELRESRVYFAILKQLASGDKELNEVGQKARLGVSTTSKYLNTLAGLRIVSRTVPIGAGPDARTGHWHLEDPFFRSWFRYVFPYQDELESGLRAEDLYDAEIAPTLADHVAPVFEDWSRSWIRQTFGKEAQRVGPWWGPSLHQLRRERLRQTEEIDAVGISRGRVTVLGEAQWRNKRMDVNILQDLHSYKIPALQQAGYSVADQPRIVLFARSGYSAALRAQVSANTRITLVQVAEQLDQPG